MPIPDFLPRPPSPAPADQEPSYPHVLSNELLPDDRVRVTFALPGLRSISVTMPASTWLEGHHLSVGSEIADVLDGLLPPVEDDGGAFDRDESDQAPG